MDEQRQDNQLESTYNSSVLIQNVVLKTYREQWTIEKGGERGYDVMMKFQTIQFSINIVFVYKHLNIKTVQLNVKKVLFETIQLSIITQF